MAYSTGASDEERRKTRFEPSEAPSGRHGRLIERVVAPWPPAHSRHPQDLDEIGHVHGHLLDLGIVELLNLTERTHVLGREEVDRHTLTTEAATTADACSVGQVA